MMRRNRTAFEAALAEEGLIARAQGLIVEAMQRANVSQRELATRLDVTEAAISKILSEKPNLTLRRFARVMHALGDKAYISSERFELENATPIRSGWVTKRSGAWQCSGPDEVDMTHHAFEHANENFVSGSEVCDLEAVSYERARPSQPPRSLSKAFA